ncbi:MAG: Holliday junction branch migration protein RuvA [Bdellovibrionales bacterium]|nr:Holliday junction branch migration protein RuvA [Bdellovibrionales bacterium]
MIGYVSGAVKFIEANNVIIDVNGVGYELTCSANTLMDTKKDGSMALWVYTHVREDALQLYGFSSKVEKKLFESLLKVNGIGPKMAVTILSGASLDKIIDAIESKDIKTLTAFPKVGKKIAEQMILTLKGQLVLDESKSPQAQAHEDVHSALINLGFRSADVQNVLKDLGGDMTFEDKLRKALSTLGGHR